MGQDSNVALGCAIQNDSILSHNHSRSSICPNFAAAQRSLFHFFQILGHAISLDKTFLQVPRSLLVAHQRASNLTDRSTISFRPRSLQPKLLPYLSRSLSGPLLHVVAKLLEVVSMSLALVYTILAASPVILLALAFLRSTLLSKYLDDPRQKRPAR